MNNIYKWQSEYANLQRKGQEFDELYSTLLASPLLPTDPPYIAQKRAALINSAAQIKRSIEAARQGGNVLAGQMDLGFIPLLLIGAAASGITYWTADTVKFIKDTQEVNRLVSEGVSREKAHEIVKGSNTSIPRAINKVVDIIPWALGGLVLYTILRRI